MAGFVDLVALLYKACCACLFLLISISLKAQAQYSLDELLSHSLKTHPQFIANDFLAKSAQFALNSAKNGYYPILSIKITKVDASNGDSNYSADDKVSFFNLTQPLYAGGEIDAKVDLASAKLELQQADNMKKTFDTLYKIVELFTNLYQKNNHYNNYKEQQKLYKNLNNTIKKRFNAGIIAKTDYYSIVQKQAEFNQQLQMLSLDIENIVEQLKIYTNLDLQADNIAFDFKNMPYDIDIQPLSKNHYKIKHIQAQIKIAKANKDQTLSQILPKINLRFEHQIGNFSTHNFNKENRIFLELTDTFGFNSINNVKSINAKAKALEFELIASQISINREIKSQYTEYLNTKKQIKLQRPIIAKLLDIVNSKQRLFKAGKTSWQDYLAEIDKLINAKNKLQNLQSGMIKLKHYFVLLKALD